MSARWRGRVLAGGLFSLGSTLVLGGIGLFMVASFGVPAVHWWYAFLGGLTLGLGVCGTIAAWLTWQESEHGSSPRK